MAKVKQQSRGKKFVKDFGIYAIGNIGSKLITFLMIPLYTFFVEKPSDYGYFDLCLEFCLLLVPIVTLQLRDGAFRFLLDTKDTTHRTRIVSFVYRSIIYNALITVAIALILSLFFSIRYIEYVVALLITISFYEVLAQITRGLGNNKAFISVGLIASFGIGLFSLIFVAGFNMGIKGIFIANILARLVSIAIVETWMKTFSRFFRLKANVKTVTREILKYSIPLIPVTLCGLLPPLSDRLFLKHYWGLEEAGIYAIAARLASIINILSVIFYQTWQENSIQQYNSPDRDSFFSKIFNMYIYVLAIVLIGYIFTIKTCFTWLVAPNYQESLIYLYPIGLSWIIIAISNYFYLPYQCAKDTKSVIPSVFILASVNLLLNYLLVPVWGIFGVIATSITAYMIVTAYLWIDTRKYFTLHFSPRSLIPLAIIVFSTIPFYYNPNHFADILYIIVATTIIVIAMPKGFKKEFIKRIKKRLGQSQQNESNPALS